MQEQQEKPKLLDRLKDKYRLVVVNEVTFEEQASFRFSRLRLISAISSMIMLIVVITVVIIFYTPIRELIPGYPDDDIRSVGIVNSNMAVSMEQELETRQRYMDNLQRILNGEDGIDSTLLTEESSISYDTLSLANSTLDSAFRAELDQEDQYALTDVSEPTASMAGVFFFTPLRGQITQSFNPESEHFGIDIVANKNEAIKATLDGTVILAEWTTDNGYVIYIQHDHNLVSVYKHNSKLMKETGERVKAGDSVAIIGDTGENSEGPHLHFELWQNGVALDPQTLMVFQ